MSPPDWGLPASATNSCRSRSCAPGGDALPLTAALAGRQILSVNLDLSRCASVILTADNAPACTVPELRVARVTYGEVLAGTNAYDIALTARNDPCVLQTSDIAVPGAILYPAPVVNAEPAATPTGEVVVSSDVPGYLSLYFPQPGSTDCRDGSLTAPLRLSIAGQTLGVDPPDAARGFRVCRVGTTFSVSTSPLGH